MIIFKNWWLLHPNSNQFGAVSNEIVNSLTCYKKDARLLLHAAPASYSDILILSLGTDVANIDFALNQANDANLYLTGERVGMVYWTLEGGEGINS